jgi:hypothetical protein
MLSVNSKFNTWEEPGSFNSHLSALIYCGQLWIFRFACRAVDTSELDASAREGSDDGLDEELDTQMRKYFSNTVSKPFAYLLLWRRRLFGIAPLTMVNRPASWNLDKSTVTYQGVSISMDDVRRLCLHTVTRARGLLYENLMFGIKHLPKLLPKHLEDIDSERTMGWWFAKHPQNAIQLNRREEILAEHVASTPELHNLYLETKEGENGATSFHWRRSSVRLYRHLAQEFLQELAASIHFGAGPLVRAPEFLSPIWRKTEQLRNIQLRYG